jgi:hypothetical protein
VDLDGDQSAFELIFHNSSPATIEKGNVCCGRTNTLTIGAAISVDSSTAGASTINTDVVANGNQTWINDSANPLTINGAICCSANLATGGTGTIVLGGQDDQNDFSGTASIGNGTLKATAADAIPHKWAVTVDGTLNTGGFDQTIGSLTGSGTVTTAGAGGGIIVVGDDNTSPAAFTGSIASTGSGYLTLQKVGTGNLTLSGSSQLASLYATGGIVELASSGTINASSRINVYGGGTLTLDGGNSSVTRSGNSVLAVGEFGASDPSGVLNIGAATNGAVYTSGTGGIIVDRSGTVNIGSASVGGTLNANADVTLKGVLTVASGTFTLAAGKTMTIESGGRVSFTNYTTADATYNIDNTGASGTTFQTSGTLTIESGAQVNVSTGGVLSAGQSLNIASSFVPGGSGTLTVDGPGSSATAVIKSTWGSVSNTATITFSNGASGSFNAGVDMAASAFSGTHATLNVLSGASVSLGNLTVAPNNDPSMSATIDVNGAGSLVSQTGASTITLGNAGSTLPLSPGAINIGTTANGGTLTTGTGLFTINKTGAVTVGSGANTGTLNVSGPITINTGGTLIVNSGSVATISGAFTGTAIAGGGQVSFQSDINPGVGAATATFGGNVALSSAAKLNIEIGGTTSGTQFDHVNVTNQLALDGTLSISLINSFTPAAGNSFDILDWGTLTGRFSAAQLPALPSGLGWNLSRLDSSGVISVISPPGDFNGNGTVDAADYVLWRKTDGTPAGYAAWRTNFGSTAGGGSGAVTNIAAPEPASIVILIMATLAICVRRHCASVTSTH